MPEFYMFLARKNYRDTGIFIIFARKINKIPQFYMIFARKMPEFYIKISPKKVFSRILGGTCPLPLPPVSYTYVDVGLLNRCGSCINVYDVRVLYCVRDAG